MTTSRKILIWIPRVLSIAFVLFLSLFALDVFDQYAGLSALLPLFMHLLPALGLLIVCVVAWKYEWVGAVVFLGFAVLYVWDVGLARPWSWYAAIAAPSALVGILYLISWSQRKK